MRGLVFKGNKEVEILKFDDPSPGPDDAIIEIKASGFCGSDLPYYREGHLQIIRKYGFKIPDGPVIGGHEPAGVVVALGSNAGGGVLNIGDRIAVYHYDGCRYCDQCRQGWSQLCENGAEVFGQTTHGAHAELMRVPAKTLIPLPDGVSFAAGAAIACGSGTAFGALERLDVSARDTLAVFGLGPVGQSAVLFGAAMGIEVIAVDISADRVEQAKSFGAAHVINASEADPVAAIKNLTGGLGVTKAVDCSGKLPGQQAAVRATKTWGETALVGIGGDVELNVMNDLVAKQRTVIGHWTFSDVIMRDCARFVASHELDLDKLFSHRWSLDEASEAYAEFDKQTSGKAVFEF